MHLEEWLKAVVREYEGSEALRLWRSGRQGKQIGGGQRHRSWWPEAALQQVEGGEGEGGGGGEVAGEHPPTLEKWVQFDFD